MKRIAALTFVMFFALTVHATMVKPMTVEEMTAAASHVVEGQAVESWASWNPEHTRIYTYTRVKVSRSLKGPATDTVIIKQIGGSAGGYTQHVSGVHAMSNGERSVLFLRPSEAHDGTMVIVGLMQGQFRIAKDPQSGTTIVSNGVIGAEQISGNKVNSYRGAHLTLDEMRARVRKAVTRE